MLFVDVLVSVPFPGEEGMFITDDLPVKEGDHLRVLVRQVLDLEVAAQVGGVLVHVLQHHLHVVLVPLGLLVAGEPRAVVEEAAADTGLRVFVTRCSLHCLLLTCFELNGRGGDTSLGITFTGISAPVSGHSGVYLVPLFVL